MSLRALLSFSMLLRAFLPSVPVLHFVIAPFRVVAFILYRRAASKRARRRPAGGRCRRLTGSIAAVVLAAVRVNQYDKAPANPHGDTYAFSAQEASCSTRAHRNARGGKRVHE